MSDRAEPALVVADWDGVQHLAHMVQATAMTLAISAHDHMVGLVGLLDTPARLYAAQTTTRGLLEATARCWYLLDQKVPSNERARRVLNDTLYGLHEIAILREAAGVSAQEQRAELEQVCEAARSAGFAVTSGKPRLPPFVGEKRPTSTFLSTQLLGSPDGLSFRASSGVAHANSTSLMRVAGPGTEVWSALTDPDGAHEITGEFLYAEYLDPAGAFAKMVVRFCGYFGWNDHDWFRLFDEAFEVWFPQVRRRP